MTEKEESETRSLRSREGARAWKATVAAVKAAGLATGRAAKRAYLAVDPDVRQHVADLPLAATTMIGRRRKPIEALPDDGHRPILCVHGWGGHPQNFWPLKGVLWLHGRRRVYSIAYEAEPTLEDGAAELSRALHAIVTANDLGADAEIDIVAHSMGGLVVRLAMLDDAFAARVRTIVTLATPHQGTHAARFLATHRALDLRPGSPVLARLASQVPWSGPRLVAFWSPADVLMLPATTATLEGADNRELAGISHNAFLTRPRVLTNVERALT